MSGTELLLRNLKEIRNLISGGERTLQQQTALWEESRLLEEQIQALIMQYARIAMDQEQWIRNSTRRNLMSWWNATAG